MRLDEFQFVLIDKDTRHEAVLTMNDLYGYMECRLPEEKGLDIGATEGVFVRGRNGERGVTPSGDSYVPKFFRGMQISGNTSVAHNGCNKSLLVKYVSTKSAVEYPELELDEFRFKVTQRNSGVSVILTFDDLLGHEEGRGSKLPQGIFIENNTREESKNKPSDLEGVIFVHNNGYYCNGINPLLDIEYVGMPKEPFYDMLYRPTERIQEVLAYLETAWRKFPDMRLGQLMCALVPEDRMFSIEEDELVEKLKEYIEKESVHDERKSDEIE